MSAESRRIGVTIGKFLPFHVGHEALIDFARRRVDSLYVVVAAPDGHAISTATRADWIRQNHPDVIVIETVDDLPEAPGPWAARCLELLPGPPDVAFTSEEYGTEWARAMGARHQPFDLGRTRFPVSGSSICANPSGQWHQLTAPVKRALCRRVRVLGVESSGTTTLAEDLATTLGIPCVEEYGRRYWEERRIREHEWRTDDFVRIACEQARREDDAAGGDSPLIVCDTDPLATSVWHRRYMGFCSDEVARASLGRRYDLTLLTLPDFSFVQDGTRDGGDVREEMHGWFEQALGGDYVSITGSRQDRASLALDLVRPLLRLPPLG